MKVTYKTRDGRMMVEMEGKTQTDIFEQLAQFQEVFENTTCTRNGKSSDNVRFRVREDDDANKYYELVCVENDNELRNARLAFGQHKKGGTLFPKRSREGESGKKEWLPNQGWLKYNPQTCKEE